MNSNIQAKLDYYLEKAEARELDNNIVANSFWRLLGSLVPIAELDSSWGIEEAIESALNWLELEHAVSETHDI
jgi:hypothetical protein